MAKHIMSKFKADLMPVKFLTNYSLLKATLDIIFKAELFSTFWVRMLACK